MQENTFISPTSKVHIERLSGIKDISNKTYISFETSHLKKRSHFLTVVSQFPSCKNVNEAKNAKKIIF
jgi:hypothetical protein